MKSALDPTIPNPFSSDDDFKALLKNHCKPLYKGEGTSRKVYEIGNSDFVLKVAGKKQNRICNWTEVAAYHGLNDRSSLARVSSWSISGKYLIMEKLHPLSHIPSSFIFPSWVTDRKCSNIGTDSCGNPKIFDYAFVKPGNSGPTSSFA